MVSQANAFKKSENLSTFLCKTIASNKSFARIVYNHRLLRQKVWIQVNSTLWLMGKMLWQNAPSCDSLKDWNVDDQLWTIYWSTGQRNRWRLWPNEFTTMKLMSMSFNQLATIHNKYQFKESRYRELNASLNSWSIKFWKLKGSQRGCILPWAILQCYLEFKLRYLKNLILSKRIIWAYYFV